MRNSDESGLKGSPLSFLGRVWRLCRTSWATSLAVTVCLLFSTTADAETIRLVGKTFDGAAHDLTLDEIDSLGTIEVEVYNPYEKAELQYSGVLLDKLAARFGAPDAKMIRMTAIDDYRIDFSREEWLDFRILFVTRVKGERFGLEKKGPARIVYPDFDPESEAYQVNLPKWMWMIEEVRFE